MHLIIKTGSVNKAVLIVHIFDLQYWTIFNRWTILNMHAALSRTSVLSTLPLRSFRQRERNLGTRLLTQYITITWWRLIIWRFVGDFNFVLKRAVFSSEQNHLHKHSQNKECRLPIISKLIFNLCYCARRHAAIREQMSP